MRRPAGEGDPPPQGEILPADRAQAAVDAAQAEDEVRGLKAQRAPLPVHAGSAPFAMAGDGALFAPAPRVEQGLDAFANGEPSEGALPGHRLGPAQLLRAGPPPRDLLDFALPAHPSDSNLRPWGRSAPTGGGG